MIGSDQTPRRNIAKITFSDIARLAGVGTATVERVLNGRGGVSEGTAQKVVSAARALDYPKRLPEKHRGLLRIEVILVRPETTFFARLSRSFERIAATLDPSVSVHRTFLEESDPQAIARHIADPGMRRSGLILAVPEHRSIRAALVAFSAKRIPVIQIVTQIAGLDTDYVGIDNEAAGRMAGLLMASIQKKPGTVVAFCHSPVYAVHRQRMRGFSAYMARPAAGHLAFAQISFTHDSEVRAAEALTEAFRSYPDLAGLYSAGGANFVLCDALRKHQRGRDVFFVGHELTERSAAALRDGTMGAVLDQAPEAQARRALDMVLSRLGLLEAPVDNPPIRFITVTAENV